MRFLVLVLAMLVIQALAHPDTSRRARRDTTEASGSDGSGSGSEASGESSGASGESSGEASGESSGESSGEAFGESSGIEGSGDEASGEESGEEASGEEQTVPAGQVSVALIEKLEDDAKQMQDESQDLVQQTNKILEQLNTLSTNAQKVSDAARVVFFTANTLHQQANNGRTDGNGIESSGIESSGIESSGIESSGASNTELSNGLNGGVNSTASKDGTCSSMAACFGDDECGKSGKCVGAFVGTCNCNACINFWSCGNDRGCGGLQGACSNATARCDCFAGFASNGFSSYLDALNGLCNVKKCTRNSDNCFGLPCNAGQCICLN
ncbi:unnamed protein product [Caenorhabditis auriculariae]|uniref:Chondroitin proteoglycan 3 n=1 Tax=Caenorhabditis auriculariae TaxID=2777116 RepID=A0A8S1HSS2_9PELO|nr:unnamed protein product [Caenorhabditis auriculariae]